MSFTLSNAVALLAYMIWIVLLNRIFGIPFYWDRLRLTAEEYRQRQQEAKRKLSAHAYGCRQALIGCGLVGWLQLANSLYGEPFHPVRFAGALSAVCVLFYVLGRSDWNEERQVSPTGTMQDV